MLMASYPRSLWAMMAALAIALSTVLLPGCGDDGGPGGELSVSLAVDSTGVEICATRALLANVVHGQASQVDWYVNGIQGGNATIGTISQANPATYTAPDSIPSPATVTLRVVSRQDSTKADSCRVTIQFTVFHVNAASGNDDTGTGCITKPFKTIIHGLAVADSGKTVRVAAGTYDPANGEVFAIAIPRGVSLIGEDRETTIIRKPPDQSDASAAVALNGKRSVLRNFTIDEGGPENLEWQHAVYVGNGAPDAVIDSIIFPERAYLSVIRVDDAINATVTNCLFVVDDGRLDGRGMEIVFGDEGTVVRDCVFTGFGTGIFFNISSDALIQGCTFDGNSYGISICCFNSDTSNPNPDIGGGARGSLGGNTFGDNSACGLYNETRSNVYAKYNTWAHQPPSAGTDYCNTGTGSIIIQ
jgi:hypothetical protein